MGKCTILIVEYPLKALRLRGGIQTSVKNIKSISCTIKDKVHPVFRISKPSFIITSVLTVVSGKTAGGFNWLGGGTILYRSALVNLKQKLL
jgi:hypothetical protein